MNTSPILKLIHEIWSTLRHPETSETFLDALTTLWKLLVRFVLLLFLLALLVIATAVWLWGSAFQKGRDYREFLTKDPQPSEEDFLARIAQDIQTFFKGLADFAGTIAMQLLGVKDSATPTTGAQPKALGASETPITSFMKTITSVEKSVNPSSYD